MSNISGLAGLVSTIADVHDRAQVILCNKFFNICQNERTIFENQLLALQMNNNNNNNNIATTLMLTFFMIQLMVI